MGNENAERIQTSLLNGIEKRVLVWIADRLPAWVTSDMLTYLGVAGAVLYAAFCWMAQCNVNYFWFAFLGLVINWFGDSLDGSVARVRQTQRPKYGFFIDHSLDAIVMGKFRLTYASLGPTEMRLIIIAVCILYIYFPLDDVSLRIGNQAFSVYDCLGALVAAGLFLVYIGSLVKNLRALAKIDPPKPFRK